jgi:large repetitive protein
LIGNVVKNDKLLNSTSFTVKINNTVKNGNLTVNTEGGITYNPTADFKGSDYFTYQVCTNLCPNTCQKANALINVTEAVKKIFKASEIITPNDDNINDALVIEGFDVTDPNNKSSIVIYNQWGGLVFKASPYMNNWKGTFQDAPLPEGTYYYIFQADPASEPVKTFITVIR